MRGRVIVALLVAMVAAGCGGDGKPTATPPPTGACCAAAGTCTVTTQADCTGTWTATGVCAPNPCRQPIPIDMVLIPAGTFTMGSPQDELGHWSDETPHQVTLTRALYVSKFEVTQAEWQAVMGWNQSYASGANRPVETVTWFDAISYCNLRSAGDGLDSVYVMTGRWYDGVHITGAGSLTCDWAKNGYRLPTEAEWEYVCRAGTSAAFCNGSITNTDCTPLDPNLDLVGWYCGNAGNTTHDVGGKAANAGGLHDMHGNVSEWCWDCYGDYPTDPGTDPVGLSSGSYRVTRGGCWSNYARICRSAVRGFGYPHVSNRFIGLRVARTAPRP
jgi:formylglycine-generating enzyme required for sulfatase activity